MSIPSRTVFYDIANTLASVRLSPDGEHIVDFRPYPDSASWLEEHRRGQWRVGARNNLGSIPHDEILDRLRSAGLLGYLDPDLVVPALALADDAAAFGAFAERAREGQSAETADEPGPLFVGEDAVDRAQAASSMRVAPYPLLAMLPSGEALRYLHIRVPPRLVSTDWRALLRALPLAPLRVRFHAAGDECPEVYAIADNATAAALDERGFWVDRLGEDNDPRTGDLCLATHFEPVGRGGPAPASAIPGASPGSRAGADVRVLASTGEGLLVLVSGETQLETGHDNGAPHLHTIKLAPLAALLDPVAPCRATPPATPAAQLAPPASTIPELLSPDEMDVIRTMIDAGTMKCYLERYSGALQIREGVTIRSRDIRDPGNAETVRALARDLEADPRVEVRLHPFSHAGIRCANVEARLPRSGLSGVVLVTAHLDSIARSAGEGPADSARGADDNASGIAGVLCAARALLHLAREGVMHRELRFVLFNAEEYSVAGSGAYAIDSKRMGDDITAVINMDMVGFDGVPPRIFEVHAGGGEPGVFARSLSLARLVAALGPQVSEDRRNPLVAQLYQDEEGKPDPANGWSDHSHFHTTGFPACLVCEDFWPDPDGKRDHNEHHHTPEDIHIHVDNNYAADIARAVAAAAWVAATRVGPPWV